MSLLEELSRFNFSTLKISRLSGGNLERVARDLEKQAEGLDQKLLEPPREIIEEVVQMLRRDVEEIPRKSLKLVAAGGIDQLSAEVDGQNLVEKFLKVVTDSGSSILMKSLLLGYLRISHQNLLVVSILRQVLNKHKNSLPSRWIERVNRFDLLMEPTGLTLANQILFNSELSPSKIFEDAGIKRGLVLSGGFSTTVFSCIVDELSRKHDKNKLARFLELAEEKNIDGQYFYPFTSPNIGNIAEVCNALLNPYLTQSPDEGIKTQIENFLLERFEDPRVNRRRWSKVAAEHSAVLSRWLTQQSFELLMKVLKRSNNTGQWKERAVFWGHYLDNEFVSDAWIVLGPDANYYAEKLIEEGEIKSKSSYGVLSAASYSPVQAIHSVILLKIGELVVSEWTHEGKVRFYRTSNPKKQVFYKESYSSANLRSDDAPDYFKRHQGNWQLDVENYIYQVTGIPGPSRGRVRRSQGVDGNLTGQARCAKCNTLTQERWLNTFGFCSDCAGGKIRNR